MSKSGIQSSRGDGYQTLVAFDWALTVLSDPDYPWLEVDSVTWQVDDVVIGRADGTKICCQCKKNQTAHRAWSIADLAEELHKASRLLASDPKTVVRFYSRSAFGELAALREFSTNYADESAYSINLGKAHEQTDASLKELLVKQAPNLSSYQFLGRTTFEISPELDRMETLLHERLRQLASNPLAAYNALWTRLDQLGMRVNGNNRQTAATQHRLTKDDFKILLAQAGAMLIPPMNTAEVRTSFQSTSAIGRSWRRDIGGERIVSPVVNDLIAAIANKHRSILLTGSPGSGKTCVMLALQEALEQLAQTRVDLLPLFIQSREFAEVVTAQDRQAQGLPEQWVEKVARMAEDAHVVVVIDSLDVLSIAREHSVLTYFLAQIDRLLLVPNVTIVTACRNFDRHYDRRIAQRTWDKEFTCQPLDWDTEIAPLLARLGIDASVTDGATRELIRNPRELALYVELAQKGGSFNVVTSHALARRYLAMMVQANSALGDAAMQAIEAIAAEMLKLRGLAVPHQRFTASREIQRALLSHNVLHETQDGQLTFGHQTLLDVLVISGAVRREVTLNAFIQGLPPVPFVRPSIRSFVVQLASGDRREFRKQLRTVLTGSHAFHIRRLVAESLAEQIPQDDDWPLIRDLRNQHRDVFQVIYTQAVRMEWHYFWFKHLVPILKDSRDAEGLTTHVHRVSQWKNDDADGVLAFWAEVLAFDWVDKKQIAWQLEIALSDVQAKHSALLEPLLQTLLDLPRRPHSSIGHALARCVKGGGIDDAVLWSYVAGEVGDEDVLNYRFDNKLHCQPHEFGNSHDKFLGDRMRQSTALLNLAVAEIERWSRIKASRYGETPTSYWSGFLRETSYDDAHSQTDHRHLDGERILLDAVEAAVVHHANCQSDWWQNNRQRLCFSAEGALRYFAILACTSTPTANLDVIGLMLCDKALLESDLSYELGTLMQTTFLQLDAATQDAIQATVLTVDQEITTDSRHRGWMLQKQAQLVVTIPRHLRSPAAQAVIDECEKITWPLVRQPSIGMRGGMVSAPFSFEVFLGSSDAGVLQLLAHYNGHARNTFDDFLMGGEREVGSQLGGAASRHPARFVNLLSANWERIADRFRDDIMDGVATYLAHRYGNLQTNGAWTPKEEADPVALARQVLDELEWHASHWHHNRAASKAIQGCAHVIEQTRDAARLTSLAMGFSTLEEKSSISGDSVDLLTAGINMARGNAAESLMIVANQLEKNGIPWPDLLPPALRLFAVDKDPAIRALLLRRMPYFQSHHPDLGWELFDLAMQDSADGLWAMAEPCLYHAYHQRYDIVEPWLTRLYREGNGKDFEIWGRISALAALSKQLALSALLAELKTLDTAEAWRGVASVWTHPRNVQLHREQCLAGLEAGLNAENQHAPAVARKYGNLFRETKPLVSTPIELLRRCFSLLESEATESARSDVHGFDAWLNASSILDPMHALEATEIYLDFVRSTKPYMYDHDNNLTQLLTRLFAQAEEQEESDSGAMLQRVVVVQDALLALGVSGVNDWLKVAERP
ncbi:MAG: ATP-binding protein [Rhodoferax sp.]|uniref:AAA family ATPase n=1 Tax=Rhodoferax sp. TaxID=50421 RepID=UPI0026189224|nr:ATP-binding protein [Rhodoferax sp.]MDD5334082.1 ATP-binding protein [Rhodoferax sp.]